MRSVTTVEREWTDSISIVFFVLLYRVIVIRTRLHFIIVY